MFYLYSQVARLNVDDNREAAAKYQVTGLPSLQLFPRGYKKRGLHFRGTELTPANVISFVKSPQVYLVEAAVTDMREWDCVLWLVRLFGYLVIWLFGYLVIWLFGYFRMGNYTDGVFCLQVFSRRLWLRAPGVGTRVRWTRRCGCTVRRW